MEAAFELPIQSPTAEGNTEPVANARPPPRPPPGAATTTASKQRPVETAAPRTGPRTDSRTGIHVDTSMGMGGGGGSLRDAKPRWPSVARDGDRQTLRFASRSKTRISPTTMPKPLLPVTERKSQEENKMDPRDRKGSTESGDIAPDGSSAGREGRQFTVANVGNNGRIYLRPTVRPAHLRFPQPSFVFPVTPPSTAGLDVLVADDPPRKHKLQLPLPLQKQADDASFLFGSDWTPDRVASPTAAAGPGLPQPKKRGGLHLPTPARAPAGDRPLRGHRRAHSDSTVRDTSVARESIARESDPGGFKIVITQPADDRRAKTAEDIDALSGEAPFLEVAIPSWKLGTPQFTLQGTPILRGSSYAPTEEIRSSRRSFLDQALHRFPPSLDRDGKPAASLRQILVNGQGVAPSPLSPRLRLAEQQQQQQQQQSMSPPANVFSQPGNPGQAKAPYQSAYVVVDPAMFDSLTFKPDCDDRSIVRFSPNTQAITAATPPRLVAEITSPKFMDYDLVSDFFLTYRSFLEPTDLLRMLIARLKWAVARDDEAGTVTRVRTFVALRHWVLNYFMDDFVIDYGLRVLFCDLLNNFFDELSLDVCGRHVQLKVLIELKKCWRRSCAQYWDGAEFDDALGPEMPILPGGIAGHRNPDLDPTFWEQVLFGEGLIDLEDEEFEADPKTAPAATAEPELRRRTANIDSVILGDQPRTPDHHRLPTDVAERRQASPTSINSLDFVSCSFPTKNMRLPQTGLAYPAAAHPVDPSIFYHGAGPVATTPQTLVGKRVRPQTTPHKRNDSLSDSFRDPTATAAATADKLQRNEELLMSLPYAGSLVRGAVFPPGQPFVEILPDVGGDPSRHTTLFQPHMLSPVDAKKEKASAMSSQGMKKLLGSVRRALSTRGQTVSPTHGTFINISPIGPRGATTNRLPGTAIVPQARHRLNGIRAPVRIDLLGARIAEDFKTAVREDASMGSTRHEDGSSSDLPIQMHLNEKEPTASHYSESFLLGVEAGEHFLRPFSDMGITAGSQSIVIVDDTVPQGFPFMSGALSAVNPSVEAFADIFASRAADPTPPTTPPGQSIGTPRRSSYVLSEHMPLRQWAATAPPVVGGAETVATESIAGPATSVAEGSVILVSDLRDGQSEDIVFARPSIDDEDDGGNGTVTGTVTGTERSEFASFISSHKNNKNLGHPAAASSPAVSRLPPGWVRGHARQTSSRSYKSSRSYGRRRFASFSSGTGPQVAIHSFGATTLSEASVEDDASEAPAPLPARRVLRRRPGGDLRAVTNVGDLDHANIRRSRSVGSLTTFTDSIRSSYLCSRAPDASSYMEVAARNNETFSVGMITEKKPPPKHQLSLFSTHSSKPMMRPSFEAEAQKLAQIPDDADDDGGVESALLKLEGKFERKSPAMRQSSMPAGLSGHDSAATRVGKLLQQHRRRHVDGELMPADLSLVSVGGVVGRDQQRLGESRCGGDYAAPSLPPVFTPPPMARPAAAPRMVEDVHSFLSESGESYSSIPLLDRGLTDDGRSRGGAAEEWGDRSVFDNDNDTSPTPTAAVGGGVSCRNSHAASLAIIKRAGSVERIQPAATMPQSPGAKTDVSFLEDESDAASDLSSEMSADVTPDDEETDIFGLVQQRPARSNTVASRLPVHPLGDPQVEPVRAAPAASPVRDSDLLLMASHPPSPPMTLVQALQMLPETAKIPEVHEHQLWGDQVTATAPLDVGGLASDDASQPADASGLLGTAEGVPEAVDGEMAQYSVHLPFILAFESEVLAQQFTLIEKDALHEIDWKELIDMRWKDAENSNARSWVEFLRNTDARGVEVVIARFNIMVKWAISEIVLTQDLEERARCMIKFIHIAVHCRRYRNFATMSQIAIALTSNEVSRLSRTWSLVPPGDQDTLRDLESLVSPMRNFYNLRAEMEAVGIDTADAGCIPFVGIYTHDLVFNSQRPSEIASSPTSAPLINFERCRFAATIVKTLLRLVEASAQYSFQPIEGITERCLWMSALTDEAIRKHSDALEP